MKKCFNKRVIFFMLLLCLGCYDNQKEIALSSDSNDEIQNWYNNLYPEGIFIFSSENVALPLRSIPVWEGRREEIKDYVVAHQIPFSLTGILEVSPLQSRFSPQSRSSSFSTPRSFTLLVILDNHATDDKTGFLMTVIPSDKYYMQYGLPEEIFGYFERPLDFDGYVIYHHLTGKYSNGWKYTEGEVTHIITPAVESEELTISTRSQICFTDGIIFYMYECNDAFAGTIGAMEYKGTYCREVDRLQFITYFCEDMSGGGGFNPDDGGSSGGSGNGNNNGDYKDEKTKKLEALTEKNSLDARSTETLKDILEKVLKECGYEALYNYVLSTGKIKDILIDPSLGGQASFSSDDKLKFQHPDFVTLDAIKHEMVHMFQKRYNKIGKYNERMIGMMEFERQLLQDIYGFIKIKGDWGEYIKNEVDWGGYGLGENKKMEYLSNYYKYLFSLTNGGITYPSSIAHNLFLEISHYFGEMSLSYSSQKYEYGIVDYQHCIQEMINIINKNCKK